MRREPCQRMSTGLDADLALTWPMSWPCRGAVDSQQPARLSISLQELLAQSCVALLCLPCLWRCEGLCSTLFTLSGSSGSQPLSRLPARRPAFLPLPLCATVYTALKLWPTLVLV